MTAPKANLDRVGRIDLGIAVGWTVILVCAMSFLWHHRRLPHLQIRRLPLVFAAMIMLHVYGFLCFMVYVMGLRFPCSVEYWVMSIFVPFGIAMFQIANTQFLYIASQQRKYASVRTLDELVRGSNVSALDGKTGSLPERTLRRLKAFDQITRMTIYVGLGMAVQAALTLVIYLLSRKFHPQFGLLPANLFGTDAEQRFQCTRGWEWWLSIVWQFFWSWLYAPYVLWKSRTIKDTYGWRIQTILCCIAGLPCSPLWLCALYLPQFTHINAVFVPPQWFAVSIAFIQGFTLLLPCYQVYRHHQLRTETLVAIADWEAKNKIGSIDSGSTKVQSSTDSFKACNESEQGIVQGKSCKSLGEASTSSRKSHMYTMVALEHALKWNATPLLNFAALKDFSGENISFLAHLQKWKKVWSENQQNKYSFKLPIERGADSPSEQEIRRRFNKALRLYAAFVSVDHAEFPINLSSRSVKLLDDMFAGPTELLFGDARSEFSYNSATPFDDAKKAGPTVEIELVSSRISNDVTRPDQPWYWGEIPAHFGANIFDEAESEIKYLVLTNTWPKFVNAGYAEQCQDDEGRSLSQKLTTLFYRSSRRGGHSIL